MQIKKSLQQLATMKIYFGHQSVGYNIMDGIQNILKENPDSTLNIVETRDAKDFSQPVFAHSSNGRNLDPETKISDFVAAINNGIGNKADVAFFKFCYVDFNKSTDITQLFEKYKTEMAKLEQQNPETLFVHVTVPLTSESGLKGFIKKILGRDNNPERARFNNIIKETYKPSLIFDLAGYEATYPDGKQRYSTKGKEKILYLVPDYTHDGGHLNDTGRRIIAEKLINFIANLQRGN